MTAPEKKPAILALEDGTVFRGEAFGAIGERVGEVVFNTSMTGYQEILTDPSYCGQIVTMTYPLIGNTGINPADVESARIWVEGFVVDIDSLPAAVRQTHLDLNDRTSEGLEHAELPAFSVQYHPEASPGPHDAAYLFPRFIQLMEQHPVRT